MVTERPFQSDRRRVVITGMGVIAANGRDLTTFWQSIRDGVSAAKAMTRFDTTSSPTHFAAQIEGFNPAEYMEAKTARRLDFSHSYGVAAAHLAQIDAGINFADVDADRVGVVEGTTASSNESASRADEGFLRGGDRPSAEYPWACRHDQLQQRLRERRPRVRGQHDHARGS